MNCKRSEEDFHSSLSPVALQPPSSGSCSSPKEQLKNYINVRIDHLKLNLTPECKQHSMVGLWLM